ncbi:MAG: hydrolase [Lachnospirales bacterium]
MNYYISDTHFGHKNVIKLDCRPFNDINEMDNALITNWNSIVNDDDDVWILGDLCFRSGKDSSYYLRKLNGKKHLIIGNHDKEVLINKKACDCLDTIEKMYHIKDGNHDIVLCHFPIADWNGRHKGSYHIYGHIHNMKNEVSDFMNKLGNAYNAGCMINNYIPVTLNELIVNNKTYESLIKDKLDIE